MPPHLVPIDSWLQAIIAIMVAGFFTATVRLISQALSTKGDDWDDWYGPRQ